MAIRIRATIPNTDTCLAWNTRAISYSPDTAGSANTPGTTEFPAIDAAFATWQAASDTCSDIVFSNAGNVSGAEVGYTQGGPNENLVIFRETNCTAVASGTDPRLGAGDCGSKYHCWSHDDATIGLTTLTFTASTGKIVDADIELNASPHGDGNPLNCSRP